MIKSIPAFFHDFSLDQYPNATTTLWAYGEADDCLLEGYPCLNGTCVDGYLTYTCSCLPGYSGLLCQTELNECLSSPCQNGGTCTDLVNGYHCACIPGYSGNNCQSDIDECSSSPCHNGQSCIDHLNSFVCIGSAWHVTVALASFIPLLLVLLL